jgi:hypothetical protein
VPRGTQELDGSLIFFAYGAITLCDGTFQNPSAKDQIGNFHMPSPTTPAHLTVYGFRLFPVRSPLLGEWSLFLEVLRCFSSPGALPRIYGFNTKVPRNNSEWVTPFGNPRI